MSAPKKYDVFINFRGEDVRRTLMPQLCQALKSKNVKTYIDDDLVKGDEVWKALSQAIQESRISVVIFSENYASSKWCLEELVQILDCKRNHGQVVIPVFYETDPSDIRKQKGTYETPFARYKAQVNDDIVQGWRTALTVAAGISGYHSRTYGNDFELIENIVKDVSKKLSMLYPNEPVDLVEIDTMKIESLLKNYKKIGIWGMGGMGKTTIAKQLFAKNFTQYDSACFLENVREESGRYGATYVRDKLLRELLKQPITSSDVVGLHNFNKVRLNGTKVFIVLDDLDDKEQLEDLCKELGDLGEESRLIITTRDMQTLDGNVDSIYEVTKWKSEESKKLFCLQAFKQSHPKEHYEHLSNRAIAYAGGVPLALKVLGSYFFSKDPNFNFWESKLKYLENKEESLDKVQNVLRVSYDGLSPKEKDIFLDIAFFFKDENEDFATTILDACRFNATCGMRTLKHKALITISYDNKVQMHDLLQEMAFNVVRYKNGRASGDRRKCSRLRDFAEVRDVLKGSHNKVEGIVFDLSKKVDLHVRVDTFNMMTKLRFLRLYVPLGKQRSTVVSLPEDIMPFSDKLRYFEWNGYPLKSLPQPIFVELLVEIRLPHSNLEHLWHDVQKLVNLEGIDLRECKQLIKLPDLSVAPKLKWLYLSGCESLCKVQPSVFKDTLVTLLLDRCTKLLSLTSEKHLTSLQTLNVDGCIRLEEFSLSSSLIEKLDLSNTGIKVLNPSIGGMNNLQSLHLKGLSVHNLPREMSRLSSLAQLRLSKCSVITKSELESIFNDGLKSLKVLHLKYCCNLFELPSNINALTSLHELRLDGSNVRILPTSIKDLLELEIHSLDDCRELCHLPELPPHIKEFHADNCTSLETVSTLKTFSTKMTGGKKYISFKNGSKMDLDGPSLNGIMEDAISMMKIAAYHNIEVRESGERHGYNYNHAEVCFPGSIVPRQFKYRKTDSSSITIEFDHWNLLGFIFSTVVSPAHKMKGCDNNNRAKIQCKCYSQDGSEVGYASVFHGKAISNLNMDHVFVWYSPFHFDSISGTSERNISFEFCVISNTQGEKPDGLFSIKECGVCPIYRSEIHMLFESMNLDNDLVSKLHDGVQLRSEWEDNGTEIGDEKDHIDTSTKIKNQELDLNENSHRSYDSLIVSKGTQEKESRENDDNSKEIKKANIFHENSRKSQEEIETSSHKQGQLEEEEECTGGSNDGKLSPKTEMMFKSKGNEETPTVSDAELHLPVVSVVKENASVGKSSENNYSSQIIVPDVVSDEDPFAELESTLLGNPESAPNATCSTSNVAIREALHNLECLLKKSLESILDDIELQRQLHMSLECIKQASHEKVSPNVARLADSTTSSIENIFKDLALAKKVAQDHISHLQQKEKLMCRVIDAKIRRESVKIGKSGCEDEARRLEEEAKTLDENIRILVEQKKSVELEKGKIKERMKRFEGEKKKLDDEAKNMITETKELMSVTKLNWELNRFG